MTEQEGLDTDRISFRRWSISRDRIGDEIGHRTHALEEGEEGADGDAPDQAQRMRQPEQQPFRGALQWTQPITPS